MKWKLRERHFAVEKKFSTTGLPLRDIDSIDTTIPYQYQYQVCNTVATVGRNSTFYLFFNIQNTRLAFYMQVWFHSKKNYFGGVKWGRNHGTRYHLIQYPRPYLETGCHGEREKEKPQTLFHVSLIFFLIKLHRIHPQTILIINSRFQILFAHSSGITTFVRSLM